MTTHSTRRRNAAFDAAAEKRWAEKAAEGREATELAMAAKAPEICTQAESRGAGMMVPTIHMNGTGRGALLRQYIDVANAITAAMKALNEAYPNGRDYYPQGDRALGQAMAEHRARVEKLKSVSDDMMALAEAISAA